MLQMGGRGEGSEAEAPFKGLYLMVGRVEKGLQLGRVTQKPHNVFGTESEGGNSMGRSFLSLGFWVLGGEQHRGGEKKNNKTSGSVPFQESREGSRRMTGMVLQKGVGGGGGPGPSTEPTRTVALVALLGGAWPLFPAPSPLARCGPSPQAERRLPLPSSPSHPALQLLPTAHSARSEWRSRTREASSARAREPGPARAGERRSARVRGAASRSARAKLRSARFVRARLRGW